MKQEFARFAPVFRRDPRRVDSVICLDLHGGKIEQDLQTGPEILRQDRDRRAEDVPAAGFQSGVPFELQADRAVIRQGLDGDPNQGLRR